MSTSIPTRHRFFVYAPDKTEEGTLARRLAVRETHLVGAKDGHESGFIRIGGMLTTPDAVTNPEAPKKMLGSTFIFEAESIEEVKKAIEGDIYYTSGVWDPEKIVILPFFSAFPLQPSCIMIQSTYDVLKCWTTPVEMSLHVEPP